MKEGSTIIGTVAGVENVLRDELAQGDAVISTSAPMLRQLLTNDDHSFLSDEVVAGVRGLLRSIARQLVSALAAYSGEARTDMQVDDLQEKVADALLDSYPLLSHVHALTIEARLAERLQRRSNIDSVLSPLLQEVAASKEEARAAVAMNVLAAQARFIQQQRRMHLPLEELPGDLFHKVLSVLKDTIEDAGEDFAPIENQLRKRCDESRNRLGLITRLIVQLAGNATRALDLDHAGIAVFTSALAMASDHDRDLMVLSFSDRQFARLALALRAAGLKQQAVEEQFLFIHPDISLPEGFDQLPVDRAASLLASSSPDAVL